jgi:hypothetical protein
MRKGSSSQVKEELRSQGQIENSVVVQVDKVAVESCGCSEAAMM